MYYNVDDVGHDGDHDDDDGDDDDGDEDDDDVDAEEEEEEEEEDDVEEEDRSQDREAHFVRACAVEMHMDISQDAFCAEIYKENGKR